MTNYEKLRKKDLKAITILESIIVMGIIAILLGISTYGLVQFRSTIELQNAYADVISALQTLQNRARNAVSVTNGTTTTIVDYTSMEFLSTSYDFQACTKAGTRATCRDEESTITPTEISNITFSIASECAVIGFARLTGDIVTIDTNGVITTEGNCTIRLIHNQTSTAKELYIDLTSNNIKVN
jgi:type II secretory pathway pseudopilin PulG